MDKQTHTTLSSAEMEKIIRAEAPRVTQVILQAAKTAHNEAEFRRPVANAIDRAAQRFGITLSLREEYTLVDGRADAIYNRFVVEYEPPGSLRPTNSTRNNRHAIDQVKQYIREMEIQERQDKERIAGAATDGTFFIFVRFRQGQWHIDPPVRVSDASTERFLRYLSVLSTELPLTPERLLEHFGEKTDNAHLCVGTLYHTLSETDNPRVHALFRQWQRLFREICGWDKQSSRLKLDKLAGNFGIETSQPDPLLLFFAIHTYYATFIKLLAVQVASFYSFPVLGTGLQQVASYTSEQLHRYLIEMEQGGVFTNFGIQNFLEGDFFGWYLDIWDDGVDAAVRRIISELSNYSLVTLDVDPEQTRDLLKKLYQNLMPRNLRHALGEYYTPDWLAERVLNQLGYQGDPRERLLDPGCGSGTFLVLALRRVREYASEKLLPESEVLSQVLSNVVGFDLNPLAVIAARTNYLMALGHLLQHRQGKISLPVYLADSIMTPAQGTRLETYAGYEFSTAVGKFSIPQSLISSGDIDTLTAMLEEGVRLGLPPKQFRERLLSTFPVLEGNENELKIAAKLYERLSELEDEKINGIWARIIKNAFAPLFAGRFDYIAGNPPWVNWESLPDEYRQEIVPLWEEHKLFSHQGFDAILGGSKDDISILMTYVAIDKYLKDQGKLGFIITQSVFKTIGGGQGFRRFKLGDDTPLKVLHVDDMSEIRPFYGVGNRTAIMILQKGQKTTYPVPYTFWQGEPWGRGRKRTIPEKLTIEEVQEITIRRNFWAAPVDKEDDTAPWITGHKRALSAIRKVLGNSDYQARAGVCTWMNAVYWLEIVGERPDDMLVVKNFTKGAKRKVHTIMRPVETALVYPLLRGRDVQRWHAESSAHILIPHKSDMGLNAIPEEDMMVNYIKAYGYLKEFEEKLRTRSGYKRYFTEEDPFYSLFNVGEYTFAPYKVVWTRIANDITGAVIDVTDFIGEQKTIVPDSSVVLIPFTDPEEAHYVCAILNSTPWRFVIVSAAVHGTGGFGSPNVLEKARIPKYDPGNSKHRRLATLARQAHEAISESDEITVHKIESEIDQLAATLWDVTPQELADIQKSLEDLQ